MTPAYQHQRVQHALEAVPYVPAHGLRSTHAQTIFAPFFRRRPDVPFARETWETPDDDFLRVVVREGDPKRPVAILIHGLEGSVDAPYVPGIAHLLDAKSYTVVAYDQRGCGGELNRAKRLYHCGVTEDIEFVVRSVQKRWPGRAIMLAGVSLGGNQLGKWLGTHRIPDAVKAATIISPP
ncbi:MAG: alpha/beta fold hydrolase, partial [Myxococcota bacterium]